MGHVQKRDGGKWRARYRDPGGVERSKTFDTQRDAKAFLAEVEVQIGSGAWVDRQKAQKPVQYWAGLWLESTPHLREKTRNGYQSLLRIHILPKFGRWPAGAIDKAEVRRWAADMMKAGVSPSRARQAVSVLRGVLELVVDSGALGVNPAAGIKLPRTIGPEMLFLDERQVADLADTIAPPYGLAMTFAAYTGMRAGEMWALKVSNVDLFGRRVRVVESVSDVNGRMVETPTKTHRERTVPLPPFLADMIDEHLIGHTSPYLLTAPGGGPIQHSNFYSRVFRPAVLAAETVPDGLRFHDLRHTCAALLISLGAHPRAIMEWMGHSTVTVSLDRYGHLMPALTDELSKGLDGLYQKVPRPGRGLGGQEVQVQFHRSGG